VLYKNIFYRYHNVRQLNSKLHLVFLFALKCLPRVCVSIYRKENRTFREKKNVPSRRRQLPRCPFIVENLIETRSVLLRDVPFRKIFPEIMALFDTQRKVAAENK